MKDVYKSQIYNPYLILEPKYLLTGRSRPPVSIRYEAGIPAGIPVFNRPATGQTAGADSRIGGFDWNPEFDRSRTLYDIIFWLYDLPTVIYTIQWSILEFLPPRRFNLDLEQLSSVLDVLPDFLQIGLPRSDFTPFLTSYVVGIYVGSRNILSNLISREIWCLKSWSQEWKRDYAFITPKEPILLLFFNSPCLLIT